MPSVYTNLKRVKSLCFAFSYKLERQTSQVLNKDNHNSIDKNDNSNWLDNCVNKSLGKDNAKSFIDPRLHQRYWSEATPDLIQDYSSGYNSEATPAV